MTEATSAAATASSHASPKPSEPAVSRNRTYLIVLLIVRAYMLGALAVSFGHIITAAHLLQLNGWQAWTTPFAIDGLAVLGLIGRSARFAEATRRTGFRLQLGAGVVSLGCNVFAGHTIGERIYGALIVTLFVVAEWYGSKLAPAAPSASAEDLAAAELAAKRSASAVKAAATRKRNADAAAKAERAETRRIRAAARALEAA